MTRTRTVESKHSRSTYEIIIDLRSALQKDTRRLAVCQDCQASRATPVTFADQKGTYRY